MKCIKNKCKYYFESDGFETCQLVDKHYIKDECIGINHIQFKMEKLACKISKLNAEFYKLTFLKDWVMYNQEEDDVSTTPVYRNGGL